MTEDEKVAQFRSAWISGGPTGNYYPWDMMPEDAREYWREQYRKIRGVFDALGSEEN